MTTRAERAEQIRQLRAEGADVAETAQRLGLSRSTVSSYLADPTGAKADARKRRYAGRCEVCGKTTSGSNGKERAPTRCRRHARHRSGMWTKEKIVEAIQAWAVTFGEPPTFLDWNPYGASRLKSPEGKAKAARFRRLRPRVPTSNTVVFRFGSFNAGIEAAGFRARPRGARASKPEPPPPRTHCANGHRMTKANTYVWRGQRQCRACRDARQAQASARRAAERRGLLTTRRG